MKKIVFLTIVLFFFGITSIGFAQIRQGAFEVSPFVGGYHFEGNQDFDEAFIAGARVGYDFTKNFAGEFLGSFGKTYFTETAPDVKTRVYNYRFEGLYHFMPDSRFVPFFAAGIGFQRNDFVRDLKEKNRFTGAYGLGVKLFITEDLALRADVRHVLASGSVYNNLEYTLGLSVLVGGGAEPAPAPVAKPVAPPPPPPAAPAVQPLKAPAGLVAELKSDTESKLEWTCAADATGYKVYRDESYQFSTKECSATDKGLSPETSYCYKVKATDNQGRESAFSNQSCVLTPALPVQETKKPAAAAPSAVEKQIVEKGRATIDIKFDTGKAIIKPQYHQELAKFAQVLKKHRDIKLTIEGHTDDVGSEESNLKLSQRRANAVRVYLIDKFDIAFERLTAKGYGESRPLYDNRVAIGRAKNRRVEAVADYVIKK